MKTVRTYLLVALLKVFGLYEAARRWSTDRRFVPGFVQDVRLDVSEADRQEIVRKSRYFEANSELANAILDIFERFVVGARGLQMIPASSDDAWNERMRSWLDEWERDCSSNSTISFASAQGLMTRTWAVDGECFVLKTFVRAKDKATGRITQQPRIQLLETHRVATPASRRTDEGRSIIDGIEVDAIGRPSGYYLQDGLDTQAARRFEASSVVHVIEPSRPGQYRGLPLFYPCLNTLTDLEQLERYEMLAAKDASETTTFIYTETGEASASNLWRSRFGIASTNKSGTDETKSAEAFYEKKIGGKTLFLKPGEKAEQSRSDRPSAVMRDYFRYLQEKVCTGFGVPYGVVFEGKFPGTVYRGALDSASAFFRARSSVIESAVREIYEWLAAWAIYSNPDLADPPADWKRVTIRPPKAINVDQGRNSTAMVQELRAGVRTFESVCGDTGDDWRRVLRQKAKEAAYIRALSEEFGLTVGEVSDLAIDAVQKAADADKKDAEADAAEATTEEVPDEMA